MLQDMVKSVSASHSGWVIRTSRYTIGIDQFMETVKWVRIGSVRTKYGARARFVSHSTIEFEWSNNARIMAPVSVHIGASFQFIWSLRRQLHSYREVDECVASSGDDDATCNICCEYVRRIACVHCKQMMCGTCWFGCLHSKMNAGSCPFCRQQMVIQ